MLYYAVEPTGNCSCESLCARRHLPSHDKINPNSSSGSRARQRWTKRLTKLLGSAELALGRNVISRRRRESVYLGNVISVSSDISILATAKTWRGAACRSLRQARVALAHRTNRGR